MSAQKSGKLEEKGSEETSAPSQDATSRLNMADCRITQGEKRRISLSPSQTPAPKKLDRKGPEEFLKHKDNASPGKTKLPSQNRKELQTELETGNDPREVKPKPEMK